MKIKWYWVIYWISLIICFIKWFSPAMLLIFSVVALIILLSTKTVDIVVYNVYTDDDEFEELKEDNNIK